MLDMILTKRFEKHPGHAKIRRREFAIEEGSTGTEVSRTKDWNICVYPGKKIDMSVVFPEGAGESNHCPRCRTKSPASTEARTQW